MYKKIISIVLFSIIILTFVPVAMTVSSTGMDLKTVIIRVDENSFNPSSLEKLGGKIIYKADLAPIVIAKVPGSMIKELGKIKGVVHFSIDNFGVKLLGKPSGVGKNKKQPSQVVPWGVDYINATDVWEVYNVAGFVDVNGDGDSEIEVAIIDTGIDKDHPDLAGNIKWGISVLNGRVSNKYDDRNGHGTHVSGSVAAINNDIGVVGVAHSVEIYMIKALNNAGQGSWSDLIIAIDQAVKGPDGVIDSDGDGVIVGDPDDDAPEVISMSLGGSSAPAELHDVIKSAYNWNITIVAAAGNDGASSPSYPAAYPEVIAVGAIDSNGNVPDWSNRNPEVSAPGVDILSTYPDDTYKTLSGTSMATPHVSATVALIQAARLQNGLNPLPPGTENDDSTNTIRGILHNTALDLGPSGYDSLYGYGVINAYSTVKTALS